jgi:hypothetical protein
METGGGGDVVWGAIVFKGEEGEEVRQLHSASGEQHNEEQRGDRGGRDGWYLKVEDDQRKLGQ